MEKEEAVRRLAFIKYLHSLGLEQSRKAEPYCWVSILTLHDTVELFLELAAEYLGVSKKLKTLRFENYWDNINPILKNNGKNELTQRITMEKLNGSRVAFKYHGNPPSIEIINNSRVNVTNFLEENTSIVFDIKFSEVSLIDLIQCENSKRNLKEAKQLLQKGKKEDALDKVARAFAQLIDDYEDGKRDAFGHSPFSFANLWRFSTRKKNLEDVESHFDEVDGAIAKLQESVKILALGLDYRKYIKFQLLTTRAILRIPGGDYDIQRMERVVDKLTEEDIQSCIDFVVESAITLQEFDFSPKRRRRKTLIDAYK